MTRIRSLVMKSLTALLIGGTAFATNLQAQSDVITVTVPFKFTVGTATIAPGTYQFSLPSGQFLLSVVNVNTGATKIVAVRPERQPGEERHGRLVFRNSEGDNVLNEIHFPGTGIFSEVMQRRAARMMQARKPSIDNSRSVAQR
jgi:hypothetical protein